jgi:hypothetical protein
LRTGAFEFAAASAVPLRRVALFAAGLLRRVVYPLFARYYLSYYHTRGADARNTYLFSRKIFTLPRFCDILSAINN